jgi:hypothetical protein
MIRCAAAILGFTTLFEVASAAPPAKGLAFDSARVVNLSSRALDADVPDASVVALAAEAAAAIAAAPALAEGDPALPFSSDDARAETALIDADRGLVARDGGTLVVTPAHGEPLRFVDYTVKATRNADGDGTRHRYLGRVGAARLAHVEVAFEHDAPGAFLIGAAGGKVAFVHKGGDVTALSPQGRRIAVMNTLNTPAVVAIADLDDEGPRLSLACRTRERDANVLVTAKGWRGEEAFDVVLTRRDVKDAAPLALRLERVDGHWRVATADVDAPAKFGGFTCRETKP